MLWSWKRYSTLEAFHCTQAYIIVSLNTHDIVNNKNQSYTSESMPEHILQYKPKGSRHVGKPRK
jgi:hypothetical protein